jgi:hypothetical protein
MSDQPIGAEILYAWSNDLNTKYQAYVSFGEYDEETGCSLPDGRDDETIFYYCSHKELVDMIGNKQDNGWIPTEILSYEYKED